MKNCWMVLFVIFTYNLNGQMHFARTGHVHVLSENKIKNIEADNYQIISTLDIETGEIRFEGLLRSFEFRFGALDRVVNSKNLDVSKYPKIRFEGQVLHHKALDFSKEGKYDVVVDGILYIWDEKRLTKAKGVVKVSKDLKISASSQFVMTIEKKSLQKLNELMRNKLPDVVSINTDDIGLSRHIKIDLDINYKVKTW